MTIDGGLTNQEAFRLLRLWSTGQRWCLFRSWDWRVFASSGTR